jgi:DNA-binding response OmpR family regulator
MNLVCIDDDLEDLELISEAIRTIGSSYRCITATSGDEGLALANSMKPRFVFLDINCLQKPNSFRELKASLTSVLSRD